MAPSLACALTPGDDPRARGAIIGVGGPKGLHPHRRETLIDKTQLRRGGLAEIDNPAVNERPAVIDPHQNAVASLKIRHPGQRAQREVAMGRGQGVLVKSLAACGEAAMKAGSIPAGQTRLFGAYTEIGNGLPGRVRCRAGRDPR